MAGIDWQLVSELNPDLINFNGKMKRVISKMISIPAYTYGSKKLLGHGSNYYQATIHTTLKLLFFRIQEFQIFIKLFEGIVYKDNSLFNTSYGFHIYNKFQNKQEQF